MSRSVFVLAPAVAVILCLPLMVWPDDPAPPTPTAQIESWVRQLGSPDFAVREAAMKELMKRPGARPVVRRAAASADVEVARRAADVVREYDRRERRTAVQWLRKPVRDLEADLFVERAVRFGGDEDLVWQAITDFGWAGVEVGKKTFGGLKTLNREALPNKDFARLKPTHELYVLSPDRTEVTERGSYLFRGGPLRAGRAAFLRLLAASGPVESVTLNGFAFVNGPVSVKESTGYDVVVCDGDFTVPSAHEHRRNFLDCSLVVCRGDVRCPPGVEDCVILATGDVHIPAHPKTPNQPVIVRGTTILAGGRVYLPEWCGSQNSSLREKVPDPTAPFKFFELSRVGVEVSAADKGVHVEKVEEKKPFATAGVQKGDVIAAVDGKQVESVAGFRKQVRAAFVQGDCTLTVRRGADTKEIAVRFPE